MCVLPKTLVNDTIAADTIGHVDHKWYLVVFGNQPLLLLLLIFLVKGLNNALNCVAFSGELC